MMNFGPKAVRTEAPLQRGAAEPAFAAAPPAGRHTSASICGTVSAGGAAAKAGPTDSPPAVSAAARSRSRCLQSLLASVHSSGVGARLRLAARGGLGCGCQRHSTAMVIATPMGSARAQLRSLAQLRPWRSGARRSGRGGRSAICASERAAKTALSWGKLRGQTLPATVSVTITVTITVSITVIILVTITVYRRHK